MNIFARLHRGITRRQWRLIILNAFARTLIPDYRLMWHQIDWWSDPWFNDVLDRFGERKGLNTHRHFALWEMLRLVHNVPGDTAECGVYRGISSYLILARTKRAHHLFDSFEGLSQPGANDDAKVWAVGDLSAGEELVAEKLKPFIDRCQFHKGWIPDRFTDVAEHKFAFVHIDVDLYQPTRDSIAFFYPRLSKGAILICDDYACSTCPGATKAIDEYLKGKPEQMVKMDAGGGFIIKGLETA